MANDKSTYEALKALLGGKTDPAVAKPLNDAIAKIAEKDAPLENRAQVVVAAERALLNTGSVKSSLLELFQRGVEIVLNKTLNANKKIEAKAENVNRPKM